MPIINRDGIPSHLFATPELDFSEDLFAEPLKEQWFRLAAIMHGNEVDSRGVRTVTERQSLLMAPGTFEAIGDKLTSIGNVLSHLGAPGASVYDPGGAGQAATVASDGTWSLTLNGLTDGTAYSAVATATDHRRRRRKRNLFRQRRGGRCHLWPACQRRNCNRRRRCGA